MYIADDLYARGVETMLVFWASYADGAGGAAVHCLPGITTAVFPLPPEGELYNNALLERDLSGPERADAIDAMEASYATAGIVRFAAWVHEQDRAMCDDLERRGYVVDTSTRAMAMVLDGARLPDVDIDLGAPDWSEYLRVLGVPGLLAGADPDAFHVLTARLDGETVATAMAFDHDGDCGVYNVTTHEHARQRGLGTGLTAALLRDARARGCQTASLQSTEMAERVYTGVGFRDLGRIIEYEPQAGLETTTST
jgi:ribosomal protein S18 acetylase RimI-like enzyme